MIFRQMAVTEEQKIFNWGRSPHFFRHYMVSVISINLKCYYDENICFSFRIFQRQFGQHVHENTTHLHLELWKRDKSENARVAYISTWSLTKRGNRSRRDVVVMSSSSSCSSGRETEEIRNKQTEDLYTYLARLFSKSEEKKL